MIEMMPKAYMSERKQRKATVTSQNATVNGEALIKRVIEKATVIGDKLTENRISILRLMIENPYIAKDEMAAITGLNASTIMRTIKFMRGKYLRRVGSDKNGFGEGIE